MFSDLTLRVGPFNQCAFQLFGWSEMPSDYSLLYCSYTWDCVYNLVHNVWRSKCRRGHWLFFQTVPPLQPVQNWHCRLHKGTWLSGKASVETAGSQPLVFSTHIFSLCMPLCIHAHTHTQTQQEAHTHTHFHAGRTQSATLHTIWSLSINKRSYVSGLPGKHGMCVSWTLTLSHKPGIVQIHTSVTSFAPPGCEPLHSANSEQDNP